MLDLKPRYKVYTVGMKKLLTIGQLAKSSKTKSSTIRYYERCRLLMPDSYSESGYRQYKEDAVAKLRFIKNAQCLGFTLEEIAELLALQANQNTDCSSIKGRAASKLQSIENKIKSLQQMQAALQILYERCAGKGDLSHCPIIDALSQFDLEEPSDES